MYKELFLYRGTNFSTSLVISGRQNLVSRLQRRDCSGGHMPRAKWGQRSSAPSSCWHIRDHRLSGDRGVISKNKNKSLHICSESPNF